MAKTLVAFFSGGGVTARVAHNLADALGVDIYDIAPKVPYTSADLFWPNEKCRSIVEMRNKTYRPELKSTDADLGGYDTIFLGFPIWCGIAPTIVYTFLETYDFSGKKLVLFATSGGSGMGRTAEALRPSVSPDTEITGGKIFSPRTKGEDLKAWAENFLR